MAAFQRWRSKIQGEMLPNFFKVLIGYVGTPKDRQGPRRTAKDPEGTPRTPKDPQGPQRNGQLVLTPAELGAALVGKVYSEESFKGENILHLSCAFKRKVA
jgi:hypothetical protein